DISKMIKSDQLDPGVYLFRLTVQNAAGTALVASSNVTVLARTGELASGNYEIAPSMNKKLLLAPDPSGSRTLVLTDKTKKNNTHFQFVKFPNGYYSVRSLSANRYLTLETDGRLHLAKWEGSDGQYWQFLNGSGKLNCLIPKSHTDRCLTIKETLKNKAGTSVSDTVQNELQFLRLFETKDDSPLRKPKVIADPSLYLEVPKKSLSVTYGDSVNLEIESNGELSFSCSVPDVAEIDADGTVRAVGYGKTVITIIAKKAGYEDRTVSAAFTAYPREAELVSVRSYHKKKVQVKWKADPLSNGYDLQVSSSKSFKKAYTKTYTTKKKEKTSTVIKKLKRKKTYYFRIRAYKMANGKKLAGAWSRTMKTVVK
ncbi:MAG: RICIN domain-containing protein, partial [Lachnospiraceae bacterium]|nr:RICIN domain-containing protein [Lachnospiraceae bacterium]